MLYLFVREGITDNQGTALPYSLMISLISKNETRYSHLSLHNATIKDLIPKTPCNFHLLFHPGSVALQPFSFLCFSSLDISSLVHFISLLIWDYLHTSKFISKVRPCKHICFLNSLLHSNRFHEKNSHKAGSPSSHLKLHFTGKTMTNRY